jgi:spermidine synthase
MFFLSGSAALAYQIIYIRLAYTYFGVILPVMSCAVSVFMLGLCLGSFFGGKYIEKLSSKTKIKSAVFYGLSEITIAIGAFAVPVLFSVSQKLLLNSGQSSSGTYLLLSALFLSASLFPWCVVMGTTFPFMMSFIKQVFSKEKTSFSFLYAANCLGGVFGVLFTVIFSIELFGLINTLYIAAVVNIIIAICAFYLSRKFNQSFDLSLNAEIDHTNPVWKFGANNLEAKLSLFDRIKEKIVGGVALQPSETFLKLILFTTGFASLGVEMAWTRAFTPVLGTNVYAFSFLLAGYLAFTYLGASLYRHHLKQNRVLRLDVLLGFLALSSFLPIIINNPQLISESGSYIKYLVQIVLSISVSCFVLGYLTPSIIDFYSLGDVRKQGKAYAINAVGCILGPLAVSYCLIILFSAKGVMLFMSFLYVLLFLAANKSITKKCLLGLYGMFALLAIVSHLSESYEFPFNRSTLSTPSGERVIAVYRDYAATVTAGSNFLLVNGVGMTNKTTITKMMSHLPLTIHKNPKSGLVLCFGMGTSFRSMLSWNIKTTAVELTPGVMKAFPVFFSDAQQFINDPKASIIIDDARRFLMRTDEKFDVIVIDPPPPVESSGSGLLYSIDFFKILKTKMADGAILQHWVPLNDGPVLRAIIASIESEFPYVQYYTSIYRWGVHIIASMSPIPNVDPQLAVEMMPQAAKADMLEWLGRVNGITPEILFSAMIRLNRNELMRGASKDEIVSDARPFNEYFLLRGR